MAIPFVANWKAFKGMEKLKSKIKKKKINFFLSTPNQHQSATEPEKCYGLSCWLGNLREIFLPKLKYAFYDLSQNMGICQGN